MLVHCHLNGMSCLFLLKGQLHSVTLKVFGRHYGLKEEFNGLNMSVRLSTSRHNFIPQGRTTSFCVSKCRESAFAACTIGPASHLVLVLFRPCSRAQTRCFPVSLRPPVLRFIVCRGDQPPTMDSLRRVRAHPGDPKGRGKESRQDGRPPAPRRTCCKRRASER